MDLTEATVDLFKLAVKPSRTGKGVRLFYVHGLGYSQQYVHADTGWTARFLRFLGAPEYQTFASPPADADELIDVIHTASLPTHIMLRRVYDSYREKIKIAPVGFRRDGKEFIFDNAAVVTAEWLRDRAHSRLAYAEAVE
jgi:hypothetical protein